MTSSNIIGESVFSDILTLYVAGIPSKPSAPTESKTFLVGQKVGV
jgi:hypothetical protein